MCERILVYGQKYYTARAPPALYQSRPLAASCRHQCMHQTLGREVLHAECYVGEVFSAVRQCSFHTQLAAHVHLQRHIS